MRRLSVLLLLLPLAASAAAPSLYDLPGTYQAQDGRSERLGELRGHPVLISMFYGNCPSACPLLVARIRKVESELPAAVRSQLRVRLVTFDPARDTPAALATLLAAHGVDPGRWAFLRPPDSASVRTLAAALDIHYRFLPNGSIQHTSPILLLDRDGAIRARADDPSQLDALVAALDAVAER